MADLLPSTPNPDAVAQDRDPRVIGVDSDAADDLLAALSSTTARRLLGELHEEPTTPSDLAERADTSVQNVQYHLGKLEAADIVEVVDTCYSEKGREMNVYAPADRPLVVFAGPEEETTGLRAALSRLLGAVGALAAMSLVVQWLLDSEETARDQSSEVVMQTADTAEAAAPATGLPPGLLFFLGGLAVLAVGFAWWYLRES